MRTILWCCFIGSAGKCQFVNLVSAFSAFNQIILFCMSLTSEQRLRSFQNRSPLSLTAGKKLTLSKSVSFNAKPELPWNSFVQRVKTVSVPQNCKLTAESHHLSSFPTWRTVSLVKLQVKSVVSVGESATLQRNVSPDSFLSTRLGCSWSTSNAPDNLIQKLPIVSQQCLWCGTALRHSWDVFIQDKRHRVAQQLLLLQFYALRIRRRRCFQPSSSCFCCRDRAAQSGEDGSSFNFISHRLIKCDWLITGQKMDRSEHSLYLWRALPDGEDCFKLRTKPLSRCASSDSANSWRRQVHTPAHKCRNFQNKTSWQRICQQFSSFTNAETDGHVFFFFVFFMFFKVRNRLWSNKDWLVFSQHCLVSQLHEPCEFKLQFFILYGIILKHN